MQKLLDFFSWCWAAFYFILGVVCVLDGGPFNILGGIILLGMAAAMSPSVQQIMGAKSFVITLVVGLTGILVIFHVYADYITGSRDIQEQSSLVEYQSDVKDEEERLRQEHLEQERLEQERLEQQRQAEEQARQQAEQERQAKELAAQQAAAAALAAQSKYDVSCKVVGISDGDTMTCLTSDRQRIKIRFDQIDAPETGQDFGSASKKALSDLIYGKTVELDTKEQDKYGRTVAEVYHDSRNINKEMVSLGMAWAYREYVRDDEYINLETNARRNSLGLWSQPNAIYPSDFRRGKRGEQVVHVQTQQIVRVQERRDLVDSGGQCGSKRTCKQMSSCAEARHYLNVCGLSRLDGDNDGVPCESLCR